MATIPTFTRQQGIPGTTGVPSPPVVPGTNVMAQAVGTAGTAIEFVGADVFKAQAASEVSQATVNAQLKLKRLEAKLAKQPGLVALGTFETDADIIYQEATKTMGPEIREIFDQKWAVLSATSKVSVDAMATKRVYAQLRADLITGLDALARGIGPIGNKIDTSLAAITGVGNIDRAIATNVIEADVGAKMKLKFVQDIAENGVTGWINRQTQGTMMSAFIQMDTEKFADPEITKMWSILDEGKKASLTSKAIANLSRALAFEDKERVRKDNILKDDAKSLFFKFYTTNDRDERTKIAKKLAKNKTVNVDAFNTLLKDLEGRTARFDDQKKSVALRLRILKTPHLVTDAEIINSGLSDVADLLVMHNTRLDARTKRAREIVKTSPAFVPSNFVDARLKGDVFDAMQAEIWNKVLVEQTEARDTGKKFDPVERARELIKAFIKSEDPAESIAAAQTSLAALGIYKKEDIDIYINKKISEGLSTKDINSIRQWGRLVFQ